MSLRSLKAPPKAIPLRIGDGGTELVVSLLTEELVRRGHHVTLFASGDAITEAELVAVCPRFLWGSGRDTAVLTMLSVPACLERADEFDIIHNHTLLEGMATTGLVRTPMLSTLHGGLHGDTELLFQRYRCRHCTISKSAKDLLPPPKEGYIGVVYNAIDWESFPFNPHPRDDYLLYLSRISEEKGPHLAREVARKLGMKLIIAGNVNGPDEPFFVRCVLPSVDGGQVQYPGAADNATKRQLLRRARCLLALIIWNEPFGPFMIEAMACGTPVIVLNHGSAPEVVRDGRTGFVVDDVDEIAAAVGRVDRIDPLTCRRYVEQRFNVRHLADDNLAASRLVIEQAAAEHGAPGNDARLQVPLTLRKDEVSEAGMESHEDKPGIILDYDAQGDLVSMEILMPPSGD